MRLDPKQVRTNVPVVSKSKDYSIALRSDAIQNMLISTLGDKKLADELTSTLMIILDRTPGLRECELSSVIAAALPSVLMKLSILLGQYSVTPYGTKAVGAPSYKGYIQMAIRSGQYADIDVKEVREGEYKGRDKKTGNPVIEFMDDETKPIFGYKAYFLLKDGFYRSEFWSLDKIFKHADRYSPAFSLDFYNKIKNGEVLTDKEKRAASGPWYTATDKMCMKTVLRQLLTSGYAPLSSEMERALFKPDDEDAFTVDPSYSVVNESVEEETPQIAEKAVLDDEPMDELF